MGKKLYIVLAIALIIFTVIGVNSLRNQKDKLELQQVQLNNRTNELKIEKLKTEKLKDTLQDTSLKTETQIKEYEEQLKQSQEREKQLQAELQAKREKKANEAKLAQATPAPQTPQPTHRVAGGSCINIQEKLSALGVPADQLAAAGQLAMRESTCNEHVYNEIGACGAFQSLPCGKWGAPGTDEYYRGAIAYANGRYGGYPQALAHSLANNWY